MSALVSRPTSGLTGTVRVPGDKSISHRALIFGALSVGETVVTGLLEGDDVLRTAGALRALGASIERLSDDDGARWVINGVGVGGFSEPDDVLDLGNSGTGARLILGLLGTSAFGTVITGDESLRARPMNRIAEPLRLFGAAVDSRSGGRLPIYVDGAKNPVPVTYRLPVPSAQVKSAILLAGLNAPGITTIIEPDLTRDHTERLLQRFGAEISISDTDLGREIALVGQPELVPQNIDVPGDPSSAAFLTVAALITPESEITIEQVCVNPLRRGLFDTLLEMGADITFGNERIESDEPVADITVRSSALLGVEVPAERSMSMIDEYPVLAIAAAFAEGETRMLGVEELRVKESDRLSAMAEGLKMCGISAEEGPDWLKITGQGGKPAGSKNSIVASHLDHRIAMSFSVLGLNAAGPVTVNDAAMIDTSFPGFASLMNSLGARIEETSA